MEVMKVNIRVSNCFNILMNASLAITPIAFLAPIVMSVGSAALAAAPAVAVAFAAAYAKNRTHAREVAYAVQAAGGKINGGRLSSNKFFTDIQCKSIRHLIQVSY